MRRLPTLGAFDLVLCLADSVNYLTGDGELEAAITMFDAMGPEFGDPFRMLVDERLIDLPARAGKGAGAFCTSFPFEGVPYIFCNSVGTYGIQRSIESARTIGLIAS